MAGLTSALRLLGGMVLVLRFARERLNRRRGYRTGPALTWRRKADCQAEPTAATDDQGFDRGEANGRTASKQAGTRPVGGSVAAIRQGGWTTHDERDSMPQDRWSRGPRLGADRGRQARSRRGAYPPNGGRTQLRRHLQSLRALSGPASERIGQRGCRNHRGVG